jgi:hypothetical protein
MNIINYIDNNKGYGILENKLHNNINGSTYILYYIILVTIKRYDIYKCKNDDTRCIDDEKIKQIIENITDKFGSVASNIKTDNIFSIISSGTSIATSGII